MERTMQRRKKCQSMIFILVADLWVKTQIKDSRPNQRLVAMKSKLDVGLWHNTIVAAGGLIRGLDNITNNRLPLSSRPFIRFVDELSRTHTHIFPLSVPRFLSLSLLPSLVYFSLSITHTFSLTYFSLSLFLFQANFSSLSLSHTHTRANSQRGGEYWFLSKTRVGNWHKGK